MTLTDNAIYIAILLAGLMIGYFLCKMDKGPQAQS